MCLMSTPAEKFESFGELLGKLLSDGASDYKIKRIWAISAYYDKESIEQLIAYINSCSSKKPELFIVIGTINSGELKVLQKIQKTKFGNEYKEGSGIRVTNCGHLFHSKGYWVETTNRNGMCAIGSMNLTQNGLNKNEEILTYSRYTHSRVPALVASFKKYVKTWHSSNRSKEIGVVSEGEEGILWLPENKARNNAHHKFRQENPEFPGNLSEPTVQQYFKKLGLHKLNNRRKLDNEGKFTLALYKLLFQECRFRHEPCKLDGVTLRSIGAGRRSGVGYYRASKHVKAPKPKKNKRHLAYSAHFDVTPASSPNKTYHCDVWVYLDSRRSAEKGLTSFLNVRVENKQKKVDNLQLYVSKPSWKNIWKGQYWEIYHDGSMGAKKDGKRIKQKTVLSKVRKLELDHWIKTPSWSEGKEVVHLGNLHVAKKVTWKNKNSRDFLARLLHYAIIRADIKFRGKK